MAVKDVELGSGFRDRIQLGGIGGKGVGSRPVQANGAGNDGNELAARDRIAACKQCHVVTERDQLLRKPTDDALGAAIQLRWDTLGKGRHLGDAKASPPQSAHGRHFLILGSL